MLEADYLDIPPAMLSEAALMKAALYLDETEFEQSRKWADRSLSYCPAGGCATEGRAVNLKARAAYLAGDNSGALEYGLRGLRLSRKAGGRAEEANSLRILADAELKGGDADEALGRYGEALSIDKELGLSRKIALDLLGMGRAHRLGGRPEEAMRYFERAQDVSEAGGDGEVAREAAGLISEVGQSEGR
jgi:tetratricopeptide (TPR) repeat protein